jgi:hypothetical protein
MALSAAFSVQKQPKCRSAESKATNCFLSMRTYRPSHSRPKYSEYAGVSASETLVVVERLVFTTSAPRRRNRLSVYPGDQVTAAIANGPSELDERRTDAKSPPCLQRSMGHRKQSSSLLFGQKSKLVIFGESHQSPRFNRARSVCAHRNVTKGSRSPIGQISELANSEHLDELFSLIFLAKSGAQMVCNRFWRKGAALWRRFSPRLIDIIYN